jgi:hypothetical protein
MLVIAGLVLLALGIACGVILLLAPLGVVPAEAGIALWVLFPMFTVGGYLLATAPAQDRNIPLISRVSGGVLMLLALAAAVILVLHGAAVVNVRGSTWAIWYVLAIGLVLGASGLAAHQRPRQG